MKSILYFLCHIYIVSIRQQFLKVSNQYLCYGWEKGELVQLTNFLINVLNREVSSA